MFVFRVSLWWLGAANNTNNVWNVNGNNSNLNNNNYNNTNNGVRPAFHKTKDYITKVCNEKLWKTSIVLIKKMK